MKLKPKKAVESNFRRVVPRLLRRYFRRGDRLVRSDPSVPDLHRFRIRTKRIRYIAELYEPLFPRVLGRAVSEFRKIQQALGALQDQTTLIDFFERRLGSVKDQARQSEYLRLLHRARLRQRTLREQFLRKWDQLEERGFPKRLLKAVEKV